MAMMYRMVSSTIRQALRLGGWALPILAVLCCAPSVARATCGDYVVTRSGHPDRMTPATQHGTPEMPAPAKPHQPCSGPRCGRGPTAPLLPAAPVVTAPVAQEWGWLTAAPSSAASIRSALLLESSLQRPIHLASSIFHPPRLAA